MLIFCLFHFLWLWVCLPCSSLDSLWAFFLSSYSPRSVWSECGWVFSQSSFLCFVLTSFYFLQVVLCPPGSGVLRRSCSLFFLIAVFLSAFEITFSCHPFCLLGVEVWLSPSVFSPALGSVDSSLGSVWAVSCLASFLSACGSARTLEFLLCEGISVGSQVVLMLGHSAGAAAPSLFHACGIYLLGSWKRFLFCLSSFACGFFVRLFLDSWLRVVSS